MCPFSPHLKHSILFTSFCLLISFFSTPHCITLLDNTSNLFWDLITPFSVSFLFLQFQARCSNSLQSQYTLFFFPSNFALNKAKACFSLSKSLMRELYCCRDIILCLYSSTELKLSLAIYFYICWGTRSLPSQMPNALLTTALIVLWLSLHGGDIMNIKWDYSYY